jgi:hypothetical protein
VVEFQRKLARDASALGILRETRLRGSQLSASNFVAQRELLRGSLVFGLDTLRLASSRAPRRRSDLVLHGGLPLLHLTPRVHHSSRHSHPRPVHHWH